MPVKVKGRRLAQKQMLFSAAEAQSQKTHFNTEECKSLLNVHESMSALGKVDRLRFREFLHSCFDITDDMMLDLTFRAFDRNNDGVVDETEFIQGLSWMVRGDSDELTEFCYFVFDMNGDRSLAREELWQCLKGCIYPGYGVDNDEIEDAEKEIVEIAMRKLDQNRDGQITFDDFQQACKIDPLLIQSVGPCLPNPRSMATFLATITENYRTYSSSWDVHQPDRSKSRIQSMYRAEWGKKPPKKDAKEGQHPHKQQGEPEKVPKDDLD